MKVVPRKQLIAFRPSLTEVSKDEKRFFIDQESLEKEQKE
jgi:hypothetical protein